MITNWCQTQGHGIPLAKGGDLVGVEPRGGGKDGGYSLEGGIRLG